jgi:hypothetical protein
MHNYKSSDKLRTALNSLGERRGAFPNLEVIGKYEFFTQSIETPKIELAEFKVAYEDMDFETRFRVLPVLAHELTHWLDHTTTLWGRNSLVRLYSAMNAHAIQEPTEFWRIMPALSEVRQVHFAEYYTVRGPRFDVASPWAYTFTCGQQFGQDGRLDANRPILFVRYADPSAAGKRSGMDDDDLVVRVPISVASLLEVNAVVAEVMTQIELLETFDDKDQRVKFSDKILRNLAKLTSSPDLAVYFVAAQSAASLSKQQDLFQAFAIGSVLSTLSLNLPSECVTMLRIPDNFDEWKEYIPSLLGSENRAFIFMVLATHAHGLNTQDRDWLGQLLHKAGLPPIDKLITAWSGQMQNLLSGHFKGQYTPRLEEVLQCGSANAEKRGISGNHNTTCATVKGDASAYTALPIVLGDDHIIAIPGGSLADYAMDPSVWEKWILHVSGRQNRMYEFYDVCSS